MVIANQHMPYCKHEHLQLKDCSCFKLEVERLTQHLKELMAKRPKKYNAKVHHTNYPCGRSLGLSSSNYQEVTCKSCLKVKSDQV
jgi:hypothetical protein